MVDIERVKRLFDQMKSSFSSKDDFLYRICNLLKQEVDHYDWVGFYILDDNKTGLNLGPYVGKVTEHTFIPVGKGVCGQVALSKNSMVVQDVNSIDNYLSCSINVQSEIVVPILKNGEFVAELDIDSHALAPFTEEDNKLLEYICSQITNLF